MEELYPRTETETITSNTENENAYHSDNFRRAVGALQGQHRQARVQRRGPAGRGGSCRAASSPRSRKLGSRLAQDRQQWPLLRARRPRQAAASVSGRRHIWTLALLIYSPRVLGDLVYEICDTSLAYRRFAQKLFNETEPGFGKGTIPLVKIVETPVIQTANGSSAQITYQIEKWIPRPDAFAEAIRVRDEAASKQPAGAASTGNAYAKASGAEQPATVPAVASSFSRELDDEIPF